jgi:hypothetical protein
MRLTILGLVVLSVLAAGCISRPLLYDVKVAPDVISPNADGRDCGAVLTCLSTFSTPRVRSTTSARTSAVRQANTMSTSGGWWKDRCCLMALIPGGWKPPI